MKNNLVLEQDYLNIILTLPIKEQAKVYEALFAFARGEDGSLKLKKQALKVYNQIIQLMNDKAKEKSEKYRDNIRKRWNKKNTIVSDKNTVVYNENTIVSNTNTTVSNDLYNCIQTPINKQSMVRESQNKNSNVENFVDNFETPTLPQNDEIANINNNFINMQSKREDIVNNNNVSFVSYINEEESKNLNIIARTQVNIFNSNNIINIDERVNKKSEEQRKIFYDLYNIYPSQFTNERQEILLEVIDTLIEAIFQANSPSGLKFRQVNYHLSEFLDVVLGLSAFEISNIVGNLYANSHIPKPKEINNRPYYILGMIVNLSKKNYYLFNEENIRSSKKMITKLFLTNETSTAESAVQPISV